MNSACRTIASLIAYNFQSDSILMSRWFKESVRAGKSVLRIIPLFTHIVIWNASKPKIKKDDDDPSFRPTTSVVIRSTYVSPQRCLVWWKPIDEILCIFFTVAPIWKINLQDVYYLPPFFHTMMEDQGLQICQDWRQNPIIILVLRHGYWSRGPVIVSMSWREGRPS